MFLSFALAALCVAPASPASVLDANRVAMAATAHAQGTVTTDYAYQGQGMQGSTKAVIDLRTGAFVTESVMGLAGEQEGFDGHLAWMRDLAGAYLPEASEGRKALAINQAYRNANLWWRPDHDGAQLQGIGCGGVRITPRGGAPFEAWFDPRTHLLSRIRERRVFGVMTEMRFSDYQRHAGMLAPAHIERITADDPSAVETLRFSDLAVSPARPLSSYAIPRNPVPRWTLPASGRATLPFRLVNNHIIVDVLIDGKGPFPFMVDTGGHDIVTPATLAALGIRQAGQTLSTGGGDATTTNGYARVSELGFGGIVLHDRTVMALEFMAPDVEGLTVGGMIGLETLEHFVVRIDYGARMLTFIEPERFGADEQAMSGTKIPFVFYEHIPQIDGAFDGRKARFNIDTGSRSDITLTSSFIERAGLRKAYPDGVTMTEGWGAGGATRPYVVRAGAVSLGPVVVRGPMAGMNNSTRGAFSDSFYEGNVGTGMLKRFVVTFDYARLDMYLKPLENPDADVSQLDRLGLWLNRGDGGFAVADVTPGSPASEAGLLAGDMVISVGARKAATSSLSDFRRAMKLLQVGKVVPVVIRRGSRIERVQVVPRKLIPD